MVAIIGGDFHRFRPLADLYREAGRRAGHAPGALTVGVHAMGFVGDTDDAAKDAFFPGWAYMFTEIGRERGWSRSTRRPVRGDGGVMVSSTLGAGRPENIGDPYLLNAFASVFIGASTLRPGRFHILGTTVGVLLIGVIDNGLSILGVATFWQYIVQGLLLISSLFASGILKLRKVDASCAKTWGTLHPACARIMPLLVCTTLQLPLPLCR